jgi:hypothetical protein
VERVGEALRRVKVRCGNCELRRFRPCGIVSLRRGKRHDTLEHVLYVGSKTTHYPRSDYALAQRDRKPRRRTTRRAQGKAGATDDGDSDGGAAEDAAGGAAGGEAEDGSDEDSDDVGD